VQAQPRKELQVSSLAREVRYVQNPALGSVLLWRFAVGYCDAHTTSESPLLQLAYLVLPVVLNREMFEVLHSTRKNSGLNAFVEKFSRSDIGKSDVLLAVHTRAGQLRPLTTRSLQIAVRHRLIALSARDARLIPVTTTAPTAVAASIRQLMEGAEKLGAWFSQMTVFEITSALRVAL
jgi:hypothetical protein